MPKIDFAAELLGKETDRVWHNRVVSHLVLYEQLSPMKIWNLPHYLLVDVARTEYFMLAVQRLLHVVHVFATYCSEEIELSLICNGSWHGQSFVSFSKRLLQLVLASVCSFVFQVR